MKLRKVLFLIAPFLLLSGALWFAAQKRLDTALIFFARQPKPGEIASLLNRGANARATDRLKNTPLHKAALAGSEDNSATIKMLVRYGADVNAPNEGGDRPLHYAIMIQNPSSVRALLQCGAKTNVKSKRFGTPLRQATIALKQELHSRRGWEAPLVEIVRLLRAAGARK